MKTEKRHMLFPVLLLAMLFSGCAGRGAILVDFPYQTAAGFTPEETPKVLVLLTPFKDERGKGGSLAGKRFSSLSNKANDLVVQGTVSGKVTEAVRTALRLRDIPVKETAWDQTEAGIPSGGSLILSGQVKALWLDSVSSLANTKVSAKVELRVVAADPVRKKIVKALTVNSSIERQNVVYSTSFVQETMAEALTAAVNQIFNDEELKNRLK